MHTQRGFIGIGMLIAILAGIAIIGGGAYYVVRQQAVLQTPSENLDNVQTLSTNSTTSQQTKTNASTDTIPRQNPGTAPSLYSISPSSVAIGSEVTLKGSGLMGQNESIVIDGKYEVSVMKAGFVNGIYENYFDESTTNASLTFTLPATVHGMGCRGSKVPCTSAPEKLLPGPHTLYVQNSNGKSNSLTFTVTPFQGSATIDQSSLHSSSGYPIVSGTASGVTQLYISFDADNTGYVTDSVPVVNGRWLFDFHNPLRKPIESQRYPGQPVFHFGPGTYQLRLLDSNADILLATSTLVIQ
jgi:hypothetical protein